MPLGEASGEQKKNAVCPSKNYVVVKLKHARLSAWLLVVTIAF